MVTGPSGMVFGLYLIHAVARGKGGKQNAHRQQSVGVLRVLSCDKSLDHLAPLRGYFRRCVGSPRVALAGVPASLHPWLHSSRPFGAECARVISNGKSGYDKDARFLSTRALLLFLRFLPTRLFRRRRLLLLCFLKEALLRLLRTDRMWLIRPQAASRQRCHQLLH